MTWLDKAPRTWDRGTETEGPISSVVSDLYRGARRRTKTWAISGNHGETFFF